MNRIERPLVSVIIPTYNRIGTLPASVNSVLAQTYDNLELIIVDDGSDDGTDKYAKGLTDSRVKYIKSNGNNGPSAARNLGVKLAQGEYVAFHDSDDEWLPEKLEKQMRLFQDHEQEVDLVYCEYERYHGQTAAGIVPPKEIPYMYKQGQILEVLLLQPMIGTPTIVVKKQEFINAGSFNESLKTFEDYEFTVRFSQNHTIGFVEEPLVKVYDSLNSVNRRYGDRLRTQAYIVREMIDPLRENDLLWKKLSDMQHDAEVLNCHDVFIEEMKHLTDLFVTEQDKQNAAKLLQKTERSDAKINQSKHLAKQEIADTKQELLKIYLNIYGDHSAASESMSEAFKQAGLITARCTELFKIPLELLSAYKRIQAVPDSCTKIEKLSFLTDWIESIGAIEAFIEQQIYECNICGQKIFRSQSPICPFCKTDHRERLAIAFLQDLQPEADEKLTMLQINPSMLLENYALDRADILYEKIASVSESSAALSKTDSEKYDIIVCPTALEHVNFIPELIKELYRTMKPSGIGLAVFPEDEKMQDSLAQFSKAGFDLVKVSENWFDSEICQMYGFEKQWEIYVFIKGSYNS